QDDGRAFGDSFVDDLFDFCFARLALQPEPCGLGDEPAGAAGHGINANDAQVDDVAVPLESSEVWQVAASTVVGPTFDDGERMSFVGHECCGHWSSSVVAVMYSCVPR